MRRGRPPNPFPASQPACLRQKMHYGAVHITMANGPRYRGYGYGHDEMLLTPVTLQVCSPHPGPAAPAFARWTTSPRRVADGAKLRSMRIASHHALCRVVPALLLLSAVVLSPSPFVAQNPSAVNPHLPRGEIPRPPSVPISFFTVLAPPWRRAALLPRSSSLTAAGPAGGLRAAGPPDDSSP